ILNAGRQAPSAKNRQAWRFISLQNEEMKKNIQAYCYHDERVSNAAAVILLCTTNIDYKMPNGQLSYPMDLAFAASYMTLQAQYEGWDSAILSTYQEEGIQQILSIPYSMRIPLILLLGKNPSKGNSVKKRFDKKRIISYDHW
nr:nitroreductase family protein [Spirochaetaceae bacterium]